MFRTRSTFFTILSSLRWTIRFLRTGWNPARKFGTPVFLAFWTTSLARYNKVNRCDILAANKWIRLITIQRELTETYISRHTVPKRPRFAYNDSCSARSTVTDFECCRPNWTHCSASSRGSLRQMSSCTSTPITTNTPLIIHHATFYCLSKRTGFKIVSNVSKIGPVWNSDHVHQMRLELHTDGPTRLSLSFFGLTSKFDTKFDTKFEPGQLPLILSLIV